MAKLIAFYSRADENYFGGAMKTVKIGNTEKAAKGAVVGKGLAIHGSSVDGAKPALQKWIQEGC